MINSSGEGNLWWFEWIVCWEVDSEEEDTSLIGRLWWAHNRSLPMEQIITNWSSGALCGWITAEILEFLLDSFESHVGVLIC